MDLEFNIKNHDFSIILEHYVKDNHCTYLDALKDLTEKYGIEETVIPKMLSKNIIEKITLEASELRLIKHKHRKKIQSVFF